MWQPIDTAPMHREVLVWRGDTGAMLAMYTSLDQFVPEYKHGEYSDKDLYSMDWFCAGFDDGWRLEGDDVPTHWMPLPDGPPAPEVGT